MAFLSHLFMLGGDDGFHIGMEEGDPTRLGADGIEINIAVDDVDAAHARLVAQGVVERPPADQEWGARHAWLRDPDDYRLSIFSRPRGR